MALRSVSWAPPRRAKGDQGTPIEPQRRPREPQVRPRGARVQPKGDPGDQKSLKSGPRDPIDGKAIRTVRPRRALLEKKTWEINQNHSTIDRFFVTMLIAQRFFDFFGTAPNGLLCFGVQKQRSSQHVSGPRQKGGRGYIYQ